ncbi:MULTISPECIES: HDOD domain-containing protein [unclassified Acidovorax]|uniref:HDOD domain-containing protein n=1 Tax=unclassified Acidovorax TaxID=2684926 RepID=UPI001C46148A|nr:MULTISPECIES: HDOD domain-containing protein [unclassified Acidovorax]MBV7430451.1 HDOD domain-containing protein [Acidovorax sp. sif0732]MBV7452629.1 HDOD domain-containing protein [Acidovorax sp. sif0715]
MVQSVLGSLILGYRPLWSRARKLAGIQLYVHSEATALVDAAHLLRTLQELWSASSPPILLSPQSRQLLCDMLEHAPRGTPWIEVRGGWLADSAIYTRVRSAHQRGLKLVWRGELGKLPEPDIAQCFDNSLLTLRPEDAVAALQAAPARPGAPAQPLRAASPVLAGQMYENVASRALMEHCLDQNNALALAGWPSEDVLYSLRHHPQQPSHAVIFKLMKAIDDEQSLETFEAIMGEDPLLAYRFMVYTNSAALGLRTGIDSLRRGLVMMGYGSIKRWLSDQLPHASTDPNMHPVREAMVMRARLTAQLLDAGVENDLRREIYLCGLLSQIDELLGESLGTILRRLPLSERIYDATVLRTGPYTEGLQMACALETDDASAIRQLCETYELDLEEVNRALLRVLSDLVVERK